MQLCLKGNFIQQASKAQFLAKHNIFLTVKDFKLIFANEKDFMKGLLLLKSANLISKKELLDSLKLLSVKHYISAITVLCKYHIITKKEYNHIVRPLYPHLYRQEIRKTIQNEKYKYNANKDSVVIFGENGKYLLLKRVYDKKCGFYHYYLAAQDENEDDALLDVRDIPFIIKKDSPIYGIISKFYRMNKDRTILSTSDSTRNNHVKIQKDKNSNYILGVQKVRRDMAISSSKQAIMDMGTPVTNRHYVLIDSLFEQISLFTTTRKIARQQQILAKQQEKLARQQEKLNAKKQLVRKK